MDWLKVGKSFKPLQITKNLLKEHKSNENKDGLQANKNPVDLKESKVN